MRPDPTHPWYVWDLDSTGLHRIPLVRASGEFFRRRVFDALGATRVLFFLGQQFCWHSVLPDPALRLLDAPRTDLPVVCSGFGHDRGVCLYARHLSKHAFKSRSHELFFDRLPTFSYFVSVYRCVFECLYECGTLYILSFSFEGCNSFSIRKLRRIEWEFFDLSNTKAGHTIGCSGRGGRAAGRQGRARKGQYANGTVRLCGNCAS